MAKEFEAKNPGIKIKLESYGSVDAARQITEQKRDCDILAVADYDVIDKLIKPEYSKYNLFFATNEMVLIYSDKSKFAGEINSTNWYKILTRPGVTYGHSDPNLDPGGYRAVFVMELAEKHYKVPGLYQKLLQSSDHKIINGSNNIIDGLKTGKIDYVFAVYSDRWDQSS